MYKIICQNRQVNYNYTIEETIEVGLVLQGSEVKSLHRNGASLADSHAMVENGELWLLNFYIAPYENAHASVKHEAMRHKKLLLKKSQIVRLNSKTKEKGLTLIVRKIYQNERGKIKAELCLARGKKLYDKRAAIKERDLQRESRKKKYMEE